MVVLKIVLIFIFLLNPFICFKRDNGMGKHMIVKLERLKARAKELYGGGVEKALSNRWEYELEDRLAYPRADKRKLHEISEQWMRYYECCVQTLHNLTPTHTLPARSITVYAGAVARLPCGVCVAPSEIDDVTWLYAKTLKNLTFRPMDEKDTAVKDNDKLAIYHVRSDDSGVYKCQVGRSSGGLVVLEVVDYEENYTVVKPSSSHGPHAAPSVLDEEFTVFTAWSPWSECSKCRRWGRRRRFGMCQKDDIKTRTSPKHSQDPQYCHEGKNILEAFPLGFRCRSSLLPACITNRTAVRDRLNEIMIGMCKCKQDVIFSLISSSGVALERANNNATISLRRTSRKEITRMQNHQPEPTIMFAVRGEPGTIVCPGKTHRDIPVSWRVGSKPVCERSLVRSSEGRVQVNARDHIVLTAVWDSDVNVYSCWQREVLVGRVTLAVWAGHAAVAGRAATLAACSAAAYLLARLWRGYKARGKG